MFLAFFSLEKINNKEEVNRNHPHRTKWNRRKKKHKSEHSLRKERTSKMEHF